MRMKRKTVKTAVGIIAVVAAAVIGTVIYRAKH